ncbi:MAG: helical backbone metal receptor [Actinomycetota bacterium]|nr:helical backbone metal receptor [Actinomycetota bacterium]
MRVVSLVPSVTETLLAWGVEPVACTRFCEQPRLPHVGGTKNPDVPAIVALAPDLVVLNDEENRREDADALAAAGLDVHVVHVEAVGDVAPEMARLAERIDVGFEPWDVPDPPQPRLRAFVPIWRRPWMTVNGQTYGASMLAHVGVATVFADAPDRYPTVTLEDAAALAPDLVLAPSEPYAFTDRHVPELSTVAPVVLVDGKDLFWWGARTPAALVRLSHSLFG